MILRLLPVLMILALVSCEQPARKLPYLGHSKIEGTDTIRHTIPAWQYTNQDGKTVRDTDLKPYVYVSDFFFTSCPSICPKVMSQMKRIYDEFEDDPRVKLVSFTIDPERDTPAKLKEYSSKLNINTEKWMFLVGEKEATFALADKYFVVALEDADVPGGFDHSGKIILVDKNGHVRSFTEGTEAERTPQFISDVKSLLAEYEI